MLEIAYLWKLRGILAHEALKQESTVMDHNFGFFDLANNNVGYLKNGINSQGC